MCYFSTILKCLGQNLPVVWIHIPPLNSDRIIVSVCDHSVLFASVSVRHFQTAGNSSAQLRCPTACLHNIPCIVFVMYPHPFKELHEITSDFFHTTQRFVGRPLPFHTTLLAIGDWARFGFAETVPDWTRSSVFASEGDFHRTLTQGFNAVENRAASGCFFQNETTEMPDRP